MQRNKAKYINIEPLKLHVVSLTLFLGLKLKIRSSNDVAYEDIEQFMYRMVYVAELEFPKVTRGERR